MYSSSSSSSNDEAKNEPKNESENHSSGEEDSSCYSEIVTSTLPVDVHSYLAESTSDYEPTEYVTTDEQCWSSYTSSSPSSLSSTSAYSTPENPTYHDLMDYTPTDVNQPQPIDAIFIPPECLENEQIGNPSIVHVQRSTQLEQLIMNNQLPAIVPNEDEVLNFNDLPEVIEVSSDSDPDVRIL